MIMRTQLTKRLFAVSAAGVLLAGGAAIGAAGTTAAATPAHLSSYSHGVNRDDGCADWWDNGCDYGGFGHGGLTTAVGTTVAADTNQ
ncbi:hypothetical protein ABZ467_28985 [Streptomyces sp. NPDC005727]|uniref:hypothetical protein n=1 Tax=Streptomyces sp. NPDC005727 TaxID=3157053 RepID=UPI0033E51B18